MFEELIYNPKARRGVAFGQELLVYSKGAPVKCYAFTEDICYFSNTSICNGWTTSYRCYSE